MATDQLAMLRLDGLTDPIQATLQGPTPSICYEAASGYNEKRYEDRAGFEGFAVPWLVERAFCGQ